MLAARAWVGFARGRLPPPMERVGRPGEQGATSQGAPPVTFAHTYRGLGWLAEARKPKKFLGVTDSYHAIFNTENVGETSRLVGSAGWVGERGPCGSGAVCRHMLSQGKPQAVFCFSHAHSAPLQTLFAVCLVSN